MGGEKCGKNEGHPDWRRLGGLQPMQERAQQEVDQTGIQRVDQHVEGDEGRDVKTWPPERVVDRVVQREGQVRELLVGTERRAKEPLEGLAQVEDAWVLDERARGIEQEFIVVGVEVGADRDRDQDKRCQDLPSAGARARGPRRPPSCSVGVSARPFVHASSVVTDQGAVISESQVSCTREERVRRVVQRQPSAATDALDHAHWKLKPPIRPSTSRSSPTRYRFGHLREAMLAGSISPSGTPPAVTSA